MKFELSKDMEKDFRELKEEVTAGKIQGYQGFDSTEPFILTTDWSALNIAGILSQKKKEWDVCWGKKCNQFKKHYPSRKHYPSKKHYPSRKHYPSIKGDQIALVRSMERWKHILKYRSY